MLVSQGVLKGLCSRFLPLPQGDSLDVDRTVRCGRWGDVRVESCWPTDHLLADEGCFMVACMLPGAIQLQTGITSAFSSTAALIVLGNSAQTGGKRVYPRCLKLAVNGAWSSGTDLRYALVLDSKDRTPTTVSSGSGGTGPGTPATQTAYRSQVFCASTEDTPTPVGIPYFPMSTFNGALPLVPSPGQYARTIVGNGYLKNSGALVADVVGLQFGCADHHGTFQSAAAAAKLFDVAPPVVIGPGQFLVVHLWSTSNAGAGGTFIDILLTWVER